MNIYYRDYSPITQFIKENKWRYNEEEMVSLVNGLLSTEFASELAVETIMLQAKSRRTFGECLRAYFGSPENVARWIAEFADNHTLEEMELLLGYKFD